MFLKTWQKKKTTGGFVLIVEMHRRTDGQSDGQMIDENNPLAKRPGVDEHETEIDYNSRNNNISYTMN